MHRVPTLAVLVTAAFALLAAGTASADPVQGDCQNDSKLIGPILLSTEDVPGTWWYLTREGLDAAGVSDYEAFIESLFGTDFADLEEAVMALVDNVRWADKNGNDYVCTSSLRGTRAFIGDPDYAYYYFSVTDDKHVQG